MEPLQDSWNRAVNFIRETGWTMNGGWKIWHWAELGVTRNRIEQWKMNQAVYVGDTSSLVYKVEIYECDARAFEHDCADGDGKDYRKVDLV